MKCLVVDDSAIIRRILVNSLRTIGYGEIIEAVDGKQALSLCDASVDVVLTDWNMPEMGGLELVRNLRAHPDFGSVPVILITSRNGKSDVVEASDAGVNGYIVKPFTPEILKDKIDEILNRGHATGTDG